MLVNVATPATATAAFFTTFAANLSKIMLTGLFEDKPVYRKFLILVFVILLSTIIFSLIGGLWVNYVYGVDMLKDPNALADFRKSGCDISNENTADINDRCRYVFDSLPDCGGLIQQKAGRLFYR